MLTGNYVKAQPGEVSNLESAPDSLITVCNGVTQVPNDNHTACSKLPFFEAVYFHYMINKKAIRISNAYFAPKSAYAQKGG